MLNRECILGYIRVNDRKFIANPFYKEKKPDDYLRLAQVEDRSYEVRTGKLLGTSIPLDEIEYYEHDRE